jgi:uncharacterized phage protein (TIGR02218 family)
MTLVDFVFGNTSWYEADCFTIALPNGVTLRATSHQRDLVVGGQTYYATKNGKWERGSYISARNTTNEMDLTLLCDDAILFPNSAATPMFQRAKLFARSRVTVVVCYMDANQVIQGTDTAFVGAITIPSQGSAKITFKCSDYGFILQQSWPRRVLCAGCPFTVFDPNCTLDRTTFAVNKTVLSGSGGASVVCSSMSAIGNDSLPFTKGYIVPTSGEAQGFSIGIVAQIDSTHLQLAPFDIPLAIGDTFTMYPGCTGTLDACGNKFSNSLHFGGFPYLPKEEGALLGG